MNPGARSVALGTLALVGGLAAGYLVGSLRAPSASDARVDEHSGSSVAYQTASSMARKRATSKGEQKGFGAGRSAGRSAGAQAGSTAGGTAAREEAAQLAAQQPSPAPITTTSAPQAIGCKIPLTVEGYCPAGAEIFP
jgi:hypothetical protein